MDQTPEIKIIAHIESDYHEKFGIPRQAGLAPSALARVVFTEEFRNPEALKGIDGFSHLWILWQFSKNIRNTFTPTVRPPRLGGNETRGVFATRSPFRPNPIGLSCVKLESVETDPERGTHLIVSGADLMDGTPIYDIKPYVPYADSHPDALGGFTDSVDFHQLSVEIPAELSSLLTPQRTRALREVLSQDPRPSYQHDPERIYGMSFAGYNVRFRVEGDLLTVLSMEEL